MDEHLRILAPLKRRFEGFSAECLQLKPNNSNPHLRECYNEGNSDVSFVREDEEPINAHKVVLSTASPVFFKEFNGGFKEQDEEQIPISDLFSYEIFSMLIDFIYGEEITLAEADDIVPLFKAANFYQLSVLIEAIAKLVSTWKLQADEQFCLTEAAVALCHATVEACLSEYAVFQATVEVVIANLDSFLSRQYHFKLLPEEAVRKIAQSEDICLEEIDLFTLLNEWATYNDDETPLTHVRYGLISHHDLSFKVADKKYKDNVKFSVALQQHHLFNKEAVKNDPKQFSMRYKQKGVQPFFPLTKTTFAYCTSDSSTAQFTNVQSVGMIMSRQASYKRLTIPRFNNNNHVIISVESLSNCEDNRENVIEHIKVYSALYNCDISIDCHSGFSNGSLSFSSLLENNTNAVCTRVTRNQDAIFVTLGGSISEPIKVESPFPWLLSFENTGSNSIRH